MISDIMKVNLEMLMLVYQYSSEETLINALIISLSIFIKSSKIRQYAVGYGGIPNIPPIMTIRVSLIVAPLLFVLFYHIINK